MKTRIFCFAAICIVIVAVYSDTYGQTRIRFARGRTSATVSGPIGGNVGRTYVLAARNGQYLSANVSSRGDCVKFDNNATSTSFITRQGDNRLRLRNTCRSRASFTLTVSINYGSD